jgi:uncharacterized damage-inducible protein DinB
MALVQILTREIETAYAVTDKLLARVTDADLDFRPTTGRSWMTVGQLLRHLGDACGVPMRGFVTGDYGLPDGTRFEDLPPEQMLPPAETLPKVACVEDARRLLAQDREVALAALAEAGETDLLCRRFAAPWGGPELTLFEHLLHMVDHLRQHKGQLFYYLKLLGRDVATGDLWGAEA